MVISDWWSAVVIGRVRVEGRGDDSSRRSVTTTHAQLWLHLPTVGPVYTVYRTHTQFPQVWEHVSQGSGSCYRVSGVWGNGWRITRPRLQDDRAGLQAQNTREGVLATGREGGNLFELDST